MSKKGENIFRRKDGRWEARYVRGYELSGKIRYGYCYGKTYREAKEKAAKLKAAFIDRTPHPGGEGRRRLEFFCEEWLQLQKSSVTESTYVKYDTILRRHIIPKLGKCFPLALSTQLIEKFKSELIEKGLSTKTVRDILVLLHSILKYTALEFPGTFPVIKITYPKEKKKELKVLTPEEQRLFVAYLRTDMDDCRFGILLALLTGMRVGEICALRWGNISVKNKTIRIESAMQRLKDYGQSGNGKTKVLIGTPKSDSSIRTIPMSDSTLWLCKSVKKKRADFFVLTGTEQYMEPRKVQRRLKKYTRECGLEGVHFHTLRHTFATRCVEVDFELKSLSEILGHASTSITLDRYVHSSLELKRNNMNKLTAAGL